MTTQHPRIAVVGGGIAGLTVAAALLRRGIGCEVFEQTGRLREVGAGVQIAPNATRLLHRLGLSSYLRRVAVRPEAVEMRRWDDNRPIMRIPLGDQCEGTFGAPYYAVHRADLQRGLLELLPEGTVRLGERCVGVEERRDDVELLFEDGSTATADVVVGADGIHSAVRNALVVDEPRFSGQTICRGVVPAERLAFLLDEPKVVLWLGPRQHCVCYPISGGELISFAATAPADDWRAESWSAEGRVEDLMAAYATWNDEVLEVVSAPDRVGRWGLHDRDTIEHWSSDRITLAGDAAHPMLPFMAQGANQAIEDAVSLAVCFERAGWHEVAGSLRRYEELRKRRTAQVHELSRKNARTLHLFDGDDQERRDEAMGKNSSLLSQQWLYGHDAEAVASA